MVDPSPAPGHDAGRGRRSGRFAVAALLAGAAGIAFAPILVRLSELAPSATAFWRLAFSVPVLITWMLLERRGTDAPRRPNCRADYLRLIGAGLFFAADLASWHWSLTMTSVANGTLLPNFAPIFVTLFGWLWFGQTFTPIFLAGLGIAMSGALVLMSGSIQLSLEHFVGDLIGLGTAVFYAGYLLAVGRLRAEFSTATIMAWSGVVTGVALLPIALLSGETLVAGSAAGWAVLVVLALVSHCGGQSLIAYALAHLPAAFGSVGLLLQPALAALLAWALLAEPLGPTQGLGAAIVLLGIFLARRGS
ncbi:MAG: EamA family transporter [Azospirillum sp.]|nr:EamA family transporter [Azospirillum sp.]